MPTYGYRCHACGADFDVVQRMSDPAGASCPECGGDAKRLFFPVGITFKGQGFYKTDSRSSSSSTDTATKPADTSSDSKTSTDTKSAPATGKTPPSTSSSPSTSTASAT